MNNYKYVGMDKAQEDDDDPINPSHYRKHPSGVECIEISRHFTSNIGQAMQYLWRHLDKGDPIENLEKAGWFIQDEIKRLKDLRGGDF